MVETFNLSSRRTRPAEIGLPLFSDYPTAATPLGLLYNIAYPRVHNRSLPCLLPVVH